MRITKHNILTIILMLIPGLAIYAVLLIYPIVQSFIFTFYKWYTIDSRVFVGFKNFIGVFSDMIFWKALKNTFVFMAVTTILQVVLGFIFGYLLYLRLKGNNFFSTVLFMPVVLPAIAVGYIWGNIYSPAFGLALPFMKLIGLGKYYIPPLSDPSLSLIFTILASIWANMAVPIMIFNAGFMSMPEEVLESASIDGASEWGKICHMVIPLSWNVAKIVLILQIIGGLRAFDLIYVMTGGGPNNATELLTLKLFNYAFDQFNIGYGSVVSIIIFILAFTLVVLFSKAMRRDSLQN